MNYKNRKPKAWKGCCHLCASMKGHICGMRNKRDLSMQEKRFKEKADQQEREYKRSK